MEIKSTKYNKYYNEPNAALQNDATAGKSPKNVQSPEICKQMVDAKTALAILNPSEKIVSFKGNVQNDPNLINEKLEKVYGIKSTIQSPVVLRHVLECIEDFCKKNNNDDLFKGLEIAEYNDPTDYNTIWDIYDFDCDNKRLKINFNSGFNWNNIENFSKEKYNDCTNASDNPKYEIYKALGSFLNFSYNPVAYAKNRKDSPRFSVKTKMMRICEPDSFSDFNAHYIAAKMCDVKMPKILDDFFEKRDGNTNLNLKVQSDDKPNLPDTKIPKFNSIEEAQKHLKEKFGIEADFNNLPYANGCVSAVYKLISLFENKDIFKGLEIKTNANVFNDDDIFGALDYNIDKGECLININPAYDWKNIDSVVKNQFDMGFHPSDKLDVNYFIHELCHYIEFKYDAKKLEERSKKFDDIEKIYASRVGEYATEMPVEFCAEYICGRFENSVYPEETNKLFEKYWLGPKINWDNLKKN